jgi:glycosyltransferase involved in cell wall biosynthesis
MGDTIQASLESVLNQVDEDFQVIVVDDGSSDQSVVILQKLAQTYPNLKVILLKRESQRKLGLTRNISIAESEAEWCIFHIDTDDYIGPHIREFTDGVLEIDYLLGNKNKLFAGQQIHMARRKFLMEHGPFRNLYRGEDRDLYMRLVENNEWIIIKHRRFIHRLERNLSRNISKVVKDLVDQMATDIVRDRLNLRQLIKSVLTRNGTRFREKLLRVLLIPFAIQRGGEVDSELFQIQWCTHEEFISYRFENTKTLDEHLISLGGKEYFALNINSIFKL